MSHCPTPFHALHHTTPHPHHTTPHHTTPHHTTPHHTTPHHTTHHTTQHSTPHHTTPHHNTPYHTTPHHHFHSTPHTTPHHTTPHHTTTHHTTPQHTHHTTILQVPEPNTCNGCQSCAVYVCQFLYTLPASTAEDLLVHRWAESGEVGVPGCQGQTLPSNRWQHPTAEDWFHWRWLLSIACGGGEGGGEGREGEREGRSADGIEEAISCKQLECSKWHFWR